MELARTIGDAVSIARALQFLGNLSLQTGEWDRGRRLLQEAQTCWQDAGHDLQIIQVLVPLGVISFLQGRHGEAVQRMDEILSRYRDVGDDWGRGIALLFSLNVLATRGDLPRAVALGHEMLALSVQAQSGRLLYLSAVGAAWLARSHGRPERPACLVGAAESIYQATGLVASVMQRAFGAPAREALQARMGEEALEVALRAGRHLSFPEVAALIREVLEEALQEGAPQEPAGERNHAAVLSAREQEVLELVGAGLSNKQIAQQLIVAESTVRYHLTSIFNKLGVDTRTHALAVAAQRGLIRLGQDR
jgi:non-specific serine/threonine protein kinase